MTRPEISKEDLRKESTVKAAAEGCKNIEYRGVRSPWRAKKMDVEVHPDDGDPYEREVVVLTGPKDEMEIIEDVDSYVREGIKTFNFADVPGPTKTFQYGFEGKVVS